MKPTAHFFSINSKYTSSYFLNFTYCLKITNIHGILRNHVPMRQKCFFLPTKQILDVEESRALTITHEYIQPIKVHILENIHNNKCNHQLYNLIQNFHTVMKSTTSFEPSSFYDPSFRLKTSSACLPNSSHHETLFGLISQTFFLPTTTIYNYN